MFNLGSELFYIIPAILICLTFHEFAHGKVAMALGDPTPRLTGRDTLNPIKHIDPIGFVLLMVAGFGWAKPVLIDTRNFKKPRRDEVLVALAGPAANFVLAMISLTVMWLFLINSDNFDIPIFLYKFLIYMIRIDLALMVFNLLPFPPLDGSRVILNLFNTSAETRIKFYRYGSWGLLAIIMLDRIVQQNTGISLLPIGNMVSAVGNAMSSLFGMRLF